MRMNSLACCVGLVMLALHPGIGEAQATPTANCGADPGGTILGVVVNDSTDVPIPSTFVYPFVRGRCPATGDDLGRFVLEGVPAGEVRLEASMAGYRQFFPKSFQVAVGDTTHVELRLVPGGPLEDCQALPECAPLTAATSVSGAVPDAGFRVTALGTAIGLAWSTVGGRDPWYACLEEESTEVTRSLSERFAFIVGASDCELPVDESGRPARQMRHVESGRPAFRPRVGRAQMVAPGRQTVSLSYYVGPLWAAGWDCDFLSTEEGWKPTLCRPTWVS